MTTMYPSVQLFERAVQCEGGGEAGVNAPSRTLPFPISFERPGKIPAFFSIALYQHVIPNCVVL